jgi:hypothetical protein
MLTRLGVTILLSASCCALAAAAEDGGTRAPANLKPNTWTEIRPEVETLPCGGRPLSVSWNKLVVMRLDPKTIKSEPAR